jgi:antitoxin CcdA
MGKYETISVKIPSELKELMKQLGIKPSEVLRKAIEDEIRKRQVQKIKEEICEIKEALDKIPAGAVVGSIREDREQR